MARWVTLVLEYGARASRCERNQNHLRSLSDLLVRCKICQDGIARDKLRAVKGEKSAKQLVHPSCFFDWLCDQLRADLVSKVFVLGQLVYIQSAISRFKRFVIPMQLCRLTKARGSFTTLWKPAVLKA